ncbi:MAG: 30S ribosomal protein S6 [Candidatus Hydrogenedentes bacterium]|nr:30S ribosomal protein S6 [Candidatus Hydrogenedentota bacterium]
MRTYEALYIVSPETGDDEIQTVVKQTESLVTDNGGAIVRSEVWGKRKLAYQVKRFTEGVYVLLRFQADPTFIPRLEQYFRLSETVIRDLVVYFDEKTLRLEEEQKKQRENEIRASASRRPGDSDEDRVSSRRRGDDSRDDDSEEDDD